MSNQRVRKLRDEVNAEMLRLNRENAGLRPSEIVEAARIKDSPLHGELEWNNKKASDEYRLIQARRLIRWTLIESEPGKPERFVHIPATTFEIEENESEEGVYQPVSLVVQHPDWFTRALEAATAKLSGAKRAVDELKTAAESSDHVEDRVPAIVAALAALEIADAAVRRLH